MDTRIPEPVTLLARKKSRWREASTWAGAGGVLLSVSTLAAAIPPAAVAAPIIAGLAGICGAVAVFLREGQPVTVADPAQ